MGVIAKLALMGIEHNLRKLVNENRLVFLKDNQVGYTPKQGMKQILTFDRMVEVFIQVGGAQNVAAAGVTTEDIKKLIIKASQKEVK